MTITKIHEKNTLEPTLEELGIGSYSLIKGEEYMSSRMLTHFKDILMAMQKRIIKSIDYTFLQTKGETINYPDDTDMAVQENEFRLELWSRNREYNFLRRIGKSLKLIHSNDYGYCMLCCIEIGLRRLEVRPTAILCVDCKTLEEHRTKQMNMAID